MRQLTEPVTRQHVPVAPVRLIALMPASLIAPAVLFTESFRLPRG